MKLPIVSREPVNAVSKKANSGKSGLHLFQSIRKLDIDLDALMGPRDRGGLRKIDLTNDGV